MNLSELLSANLYTCTKTPTHGSPTRAGRVGGSAWPSCFRPGALAFHGAPPRGVRARLGLEWPSVDPGGACLAPAPRGGARAPRLGCVTVEKTCLR